MRIRKHARTISAVSASDASTATKTTHHNVLCELNMSPWDVISFAPQSDEFPNQVDINDNIMGNSSTVGVESIKVGESVASLLEHWEPMGAKEEVRDDDEEVDGEDDVEDDDHYRVKKKKKKKQKKKLIGSIDREEELVIKRDYVCCNKADGKGWRCRREAKNGHSLCEHHLTQLRSYHSNNNNSHGSSRRSNTAHKANTARNCRAKASSNSSEFYYYSGFGPLWGKKRSNELSNSNANYSKIVTNTDDDLHREELGSSHDNTTSHQSDFVVDNDDLDYEDDYDVDGGDDGKKRFRKPIKARSLKSLL